MGGLLVAEINNIERVDALVFERVRQKPRRRSQAVICSSEMGFAAIPPLVRLALRLEVVPHMVQLVWNRWHVKFRWRDTGLFQHRFQVPAQRAAVFLHGVELERCLRVLD
jgi:hypothetical protein